MFWQPAERGRVTCELQGKRLAMEPSRKNRFIVVAAFLILAHKHGYADQDVQSVSFPNYEEEHQSEPEGTPSPEISSNHEVEPNTGNPIPQMTDTIPGNATPDNPTPSDPHRIYQEYLQDYVRTHCHKPSEATFITGPPGPPGYPGPAGPGGSPGIPGNHGNSGINGLIGRDGLPGKKGDRGGQGFPGFAGVPGLMGTEGKEGPRGPSGAHGIGGIRGSKGTMGLLGKPGSQGILGKKGSDGSRGFKGDPGEPGSDGVCSCETPPPRRYTPAPGTSAFSVARTAGLVATEGPVIVTFQHVFVNVHDDFDINTGKFNCSLPGFYFFTTNIYKSSATNFPLVQILLNGVHQAAVIDYGSSDTEDSTSNSIVLSLSQGDMVWLQLYDGRELYSSHYRFTTFSGFRIA